MNRAPAFQFYPDKWQSHTRRLSDSSYRVYHELLCWMWQHSPDYCSIEASCDAVAVALAMPMECVRSAMAEIQNKYAPLLKDEDGRWVSNGLRKEAEKQTDRREKASRSANARHNHANALPTHSERTANASIEHGSLSPTPSPSPSPASHNTKTTMPQALEKMLSSITPNATHGRLYTRFAEEFHGKCGTSYSDWITVWSANGLSNQVEQMFEAFMVDLKARNENTWERHGDRNVLFAVENVSKKHQRASGAAQSSEDAMARGRAMAEDARRRQQARGAR